MSAVAGDDRASSRQRSSGRMVLTQACAYLVVIAAMLACVFLDVPDILVGLVAAVILAIYVSCWPFMPSGPSGTVVERSVTTLLGAVSILAGLFAERVPAIEPPSLRLPAVTRAMDAANVAMHRWLALSVILVVVLIVFGFARQMAREHRTQLVVSLSYSLLSGAAAVALGGWVATAHYWHILLAGWQQRGVGWLWLFVVGACAVVLAVLLAVMSWRWWRERDAAASACPWAGFATLPVMIAGVLPVLASVALTLV